MTAGNGEQSGAPPDGKNISQSVPRRKTRDLAFAGILTAFTVLVLYLESVVPTGRAGFLALSSFLLCAVYLESGMKWLLISYAASSVLSFLLVADKLGLLPFIFLFGIYPALKNLVERIRSLWVEWLAKLIGFNVILFAGYSVFRPLLPDALLSGAMLPLAIIVLEAGFVMYDLLFTQWIHFYMDRIAPKVRGNRT